MNDRVKSKVVKRRPLDIVEHTFYGKAIAEGFIYPIAINISFSLSHALAC